MASKIQLKRGLKSALPTLSSGEPAYTTDTRELYIGTGSGNVNMGGSHWYTGTAMSGTSSTTGAYSYSACPQVKVGDCYLNTSYGYVYQCTTAGSGTGAKWTYKGSIKGATGSKGATGATGADGQDLQAVYSTEEVQIGTWIDGKAIMRKCGKRSFTSTTAAELSSNGFNSRSISGIFYAGAHAMLREYYFVYKQAPDEGYAYSSHSEAAAKIKELGTATAEYVVEYIAL